MFDSRVSQVHPDLDHEDRFRLRIHYFAEGKIRESIEKEYKDLVYNTMEERFWTELCGGQVYLYSKDTGRMSRV